MKKMLQSKIFRIISIFIILLSVIIFVRTKYVFIDGTIYNHNAEKILGSINGINISELNRCRKLKKLYLACVDNDYLNEMKAFDLLETFIIMDSECKISGSSIQKINQMPCLNFLGVDLSDIDLQGLHNDSLSTLTLTRGSISSLNDISNCPKLIELILDSETIENSCFADNSEKDLFILKNSLDFAALDNIKLLKIYDTEIEDISGILDMESLEELSVSDGMLSEDDRRTLEEKGIIVTEKSGEN